MEPEQTIRAAFLLTTATFFFLNAVPYLRPNFITYGSRSSPAPGRSSVKAKDKRTSKEASPKNIFVRAIDHVGATQVSHAWFTHFYLVSVCMSIFWATQLATQGRVLNYVLSKASPAKAGGMSRDQVVLTWILMTVQGARRLYETVKFTKPTQSRMPVGHYILGIAYYVGVSMAIWVEGIPALRETEPSLDLISFAAPSLRTLLCLPLFIMASGVQHDCHRYLASLRKYTLPTHAIFQHLICPHYTAECLVYVALALIAAPAGSLVNKTLFSVLVFAACNLGITAESSREWYEKKFGADAIKGRWRMVPFVY